MNRGSHGDRKPIGLKRSYRFQRVREPKKYLRKKEKIMKAKRLFSVIIAMMLMLSCFAVTASADTNPIKDPEHDVSLTITLWQATSPAQDAANLETFSIEGADATPPTGYKAIVGSTFEIVKVGDASVKATGTTDANGQILFDTYKKAGEEVATKLPQGTYTVTNTSKPAMQTNYVAEFKVDLPMTNAYNDGAGANGWVYNVKVYPKTVITTQEPKVDKLVKEKGSEKPFGAEASIDAISGKKAQWQILSDIPTDITNYTKYILTDVISNDLGVASNVEVKFYKSGSSTETKPADGTYTITGEDSRSLTLTITDAKKLAGYEGGKIEIIFDTTVVTAAKKIANDVELTYNIGTGDDKTIDNSIPGNDPTTPEPDPDHPDTPSDNPYPKDDPTPAHDPYVWTGKIDVVKVNSEDVTKPVAGAEFIILKGATDITASVKDTEGHAATNAAGHLVTDAQGKLPTIAGLGAGTYTLREVKAPANYELLGSDITITINKENMTGEEFSGTLVTLASEVVTVKNIPSQKLPLTGGMGVGMFAFAGLALAFVGGVYLSKTRKSEEC